MKIKKEDIFDVLEKEETIQIDEWATKHDCHMKLYVTKIDDKYYQFGVHASYNNGIEDDFDFECEEVKPVETIVTKWVKV